VRRFLDFYGEHLLDATVLYPGVTDALDALDAAGVALTVCSNKPEGYSRTVLAGLGVLTRFRALVGGDSLPTRKPDPTGMAELMRATGTDRGTTLLVGDSHVDVATAANAGVAFAASPGGSIRAPSRLRPALVVDAMAELVASAAIRAAEPAAPTPRRRARDSGAATSHEVACHPRRWRPPAGGSCRRERAGSRPGRACARTRGRRSRAAVASKS
jgi:ribonucleotide monophosphatase NagD (HAD superfamily)